MENIQLDQHLSEIFSPTTRLDCITLPKATMEDLLRSECNVSKYSSMVCCHTLSYKSELFHAGQDSLENLLKPAAIKSSSLSNGMGHKGLAKKSTPNGNGAVGIRSKSQKKDKRFAKVVLIQQRVCFNGFL
jgi:hypothetical protein